MLAISFLLSLISNAIGQFLIKFGMGLKNSFAQKFMLVNTTPTPNASQGSIVNIVFGVFGSTFLFVAVHLGMHVCP